MLIVALISVSIGRTYRESNVVKKKAAQRMGSLYSDNALSFNSVFSFKNPLAVCALIAGIILSAIKVCMRIGADILYTMEFGAPDGIAEIVLMIAYYSSDILVCALVYTLSWLILRTFVRYDTAIIKD